MNNRTKSKFCDRSLLLAGEGETIFHSSNDVLRNQLICQWMEILATVARKDKTVSYKDFQENPGAFLMRLARNNAITLNSAPLLRSAFKRAYDGAIVSDFPSRLLFQSAFPEQPIVREEELYRCRAQLKLYKDWTDDVNSHIYEGNNKCEHCCRVVRLGETEDILASGIPHHPERKMSIINDAMKIVNHALGLWRPKQQKNQIEQLEIKIIDETEKNSGSIDSFYSPHDDKKTLGIKRAGESLVSDREAPHLRIKKIDLADESITDKEPETDLPKVLSFKESVRLMQNWTLVIKKIESHGLRTQFLEGLKNQLPLSSIKCAPDQQSKYQMYSLVLQIVNHMMINDVERNKVEENYHEEIERIFRVFGNCINDDDECKECFALFQNFCTIFIRPVNHFYPEVFPQIKKLAIKISFPGMNYGYTNNAIAENAKQTLTIFNSILSYWKKIQDKSSSELIFNEDTMIGNTIAFINDYSRICALSEIKCFCDNKVCRVKRNLFSSAQLNLIALRIVEQHCTAATIKRIVNSIEILAKNCLESIAELKRLSCTNWQSIWSDFSANIFNISGRINKTSYNDSVNFYYLLYTYMIQFKSSSKDESSFGDKSISPLSNVLHQLGRTHLQHGEYQEAMKMTALDAFFHYDNKNCKAFDVWKDILETYPEARCITIVNFLKKQCDSIQDMGFIIDLDKVQIPTICLREMEGLQNSRLINLAASMISALELINRIEDQIHYEQGINLLKNYLRLCT